MSRQHFDGNARNYTLTVFLSFVAIFCFVMVMKLWHGEFSPGENENAAVRVTETQESRNEHTENMAVDSTLVGSDMREHGDSAGMTHGDTGKKTSSDTAHKAGGDTTSGE